MSLRGLTVLHVLNSASGGSALSTVALMNYLESQGILSCAVCDVKGTIAERAKIRDAVGGNILFTPLYWWNRKIRSAFWKRPLLEGLQLLRTGWRLRSTENIVRAAHKWRPKLIHTNTLLTPEGGTASRRLGIPHVWHLRELLGPGMPFQVTRTGQALGSYLVRNSDRIIANSQVSAARISPWLPEGFVSIIPNGIDIASFVTSRSNRSKDRVVVGMIASLSSRVKKHHLFLEGVGRVDATLPIEWRIYGHDPSEGGRVCTDPYTNSLHALAKRLKIDSKLRFPGHVPPEQIMQEIDLLVHPTDVESFGRIVVEAMAGKVPVIGANGGGVAEIVTHEESGLLFRPDDAADLARNIERMIRNPDLAARCVLAGRNCVERHYTLDASGRKVVRVYEEVLRDYHENRPALARAT